MGVDSKEISCSSVGAVSGASLVGRNQLRMSEVDRRFPSFAC